MSAPDTTAVDTAVTNACVAAGTLAATRLVSCGKGRATSGLDSGLKAVAVVGSAAQRSACRPFKAHSRHLPVSAPSNGTLGHWHEHHRRNGKEHLPSNKAS